MATRLVIAGILFCLISSGLVILAVSSLLRRGNMGEEDSASLQEEPDLRSAAAGYARQITGEAGFRHAAETVYRCSMTNAKQTSARAAAWDCVITKGKEEQEKAQAPPVKERLGGFWNFRKKKGKASAENLKAAANDGNFQKASGSHLKETAASEKIIYSLQTELPSLKSLVKARGAGVVIIYHTTEKHAEHAASEAQIQDSATKVQFLSPQNSLGEALSSAWNIEHEVGIQHTAAGIMVGKTEEPEPVKEDAGPE